MVSGENNQNEPDVRALIQEQQWDAVIAFASKGTNGCEASLSCEPGIISHAPAHQAPIPVVEALLKAGASPDSQVKHGTTYGNDTVLVYLVEQIAAAENDEQELQGYNVDGMKQLVRLLLEHGANPHKLSGYGRETYIPLVDLCSSQDMVQLFEQYGAFPETQASSADELVLPVYQPNAPVSVTEQCSYPGSVTLSLHRGVHLGNLTRVKAALATPGVNVNARDAKDCTPLMIAAQKDRGSSARMLLNAGAHVDAASTRYGTTALMMAAMNGYDEVVTVLLQYGASINAQNKSGFTPLMLAARNGRYSTVALLLRHGASKNVRDYSGRTAAQHASTPAIRQLL